jgi:hypothetical protein
MSTTNAPTTANAISIVISFSFFERCKSTAQHSDGVEKQGELRFFTAQCRLVWMKCLFMSNKQPPTFCVQSNLKHLKHTLCKFLVCFLKTFWLLPEVLQRYVSEIWPNGNLKKPGGKKKL